MNLAGLRVLLVEDEALLSLLMEEWLDDMECTVVATASRLEDAKEKARSLAMDIAVLDVNLAGQLSYPVAEILLGRGIPFVFSTGYGKAGLSGNLEHAPVLSKPYQQGQLADALRKAMA
ncbi:MAG: response regulator [Allorhizobium sp.]